MGFHHLMCVHRIVLYMHDALRIRNESKDVQSGFQQQTSRSTPVMCNVIMRCSVGTAWQWDVLDAFHTRVARCIDAHVSRVFAHIARFKTIKYKIHIVKLYK